MLIILLSFINIINSLDIKSVSQHSLIALKDYYISSLETYGFKLLKEGKAKIILQPFQDIDYFYICNQEYQVSNPNNYCTKKTNLKANTDNNLGTYSNSYNYIYFLFNEELQMKLFIEKSNYEIKVDNNLYYKCFDFFSGYEQMTFDFNTDDLYFNTTLNIQYISNKSVNTTTTLIDRNSRKELLKLYSQTNNTFYELDFREKYRLYYSPPNETNIHSMLCLTFSDYEEYFFTTYTCDIPVISPRYFKFYSILEKEWNISSQYYPTIFYFYLNKTKYINCSYIHILNYTRDKYTCDLVKNDTVEGLYNIKLYSHRDAYLLITIYLEPELIDDNCHFGSIITFNKTVDEFSDSIFYTEILKDILGTIFPIMTVITICVVLFSFFPIIRKKCKCIDDSINKKE